MKGVLPKQLCSVAPRKKHFIATFTAMLLASCEQSQTAHINPPPIINSQTSGWVESVAIVSDLDRARDFFTDIGGYEVVHVGALPPEIIKLWNLPKTASGTDVLLREAGQSRGFIRLVALEKAGPQIEARSAATFLDTGGIMGLNVRVFDIQRTFKNLQRAGWRPLSDPVHFSVEEFAVSEAVFLGPDGLVIGLIERVKPPLGEDWTMLPGELSRPNNAFVITADMQKGQTFFEKNMAWSVFLTDTGAAAKKGMNLYGWPHNIVESVDRNVAWFHPDTEAKAREGSIALIELTGVEGRDFSGSAKPPNFGWMSLRTYGARTENQSISDKGFYLAPYGCVSIATLKSPDGVLIENIAPSDICP